MNELLKTHTQNRMKTIHLQACWFFIIVQGWNTTGMIKTIIMARRGDFAAFTCTPSGTTAKKITDN